MADYGNRTNQLHNGVPVYGGKSKGLSTAYYKGREARKTGKCSDDNPHKLNERQGREDWFIGFYDEHYGTSVEDRVRAERNGERV